MWKIIFSAFVILILNVAITTESRDYYELPYNFDPSYYRLTLDISQAKLGIPKEILGLVEIKAKCKSNYVDKIALNSGNLSIDAVNIFRNGNDIYSSKMEEDKTREIIKLNTRNYISKGEDIIIRIHFKAPIYADMQGFYINSNSKNPYELKTRFHPTFARKAFPCFDEPRYRSKFDIIFIYYKDNDYNILSNMPKQHENFIGDEHKVFFETTPEISASEIVLYSVFRAKTINKPHIIMYLPWLEDFLHEDYEEEIDEIVKFSVDFEKEIKSYTDIPTTKIYKILNIALFSNIALETMSSYAFISLRASNFYGNKNITTKSLQDSYVSLGHKITRQWFGNYINAKNWNDLWLIEGFATYFSYYIIDQFKDNWEMENQLTVEYLQKMFLTETTYENIDPLNKIIEKQNDIKLKYYDSNIYYKGASIIRMIKHFMGPPLFKKAVNTLLSNNALNSIEPANLTNILQEEVDKQNLSIEFRLMKVVKNWIYQPGIPVVVVSTNQNATRFSQYRLYVRGYYAPSTYWYIPISYATDIKNMSTSPKIWLNPTEPTKTFDIGTYDWILVNIEQTAPFRVNYNELNWLKLADLLASKDGKEIPKLNRAQIVDDAMNLARAHFLDYRVAFKVFNYLKTETDYIPWYSALRNFEYIFHRFEDDDDIKIQLKEYLLDLMSELLKNKQLSSINEMKDQIEILKHVLIFDWACKLGNTDCIQQSVNEYKNIDKINKNIRRIVLCSVIRENKKLSDEIWDIYKHTEDELLIQDSLFALGCNKDKFYLNRFLNYVIYKRVKDKKYLFTSMFKNSHTGVNIAIKYFKEKSIKITEDLGNLDEIKEVIIDLADHIVTEVNLAEFEGAMKLNPILIPYFEEAIERAKSNLIWDEELKQYIGPALKVSNAAKFLFVNNLTLILSLIISCYYSFKLFI